MSGAAARGVGAGAEGPADWSLVVIDLQNDFLDRHGYYAVRSALEHDADWQSLSSAEQAARISAATGSGGGLIDGSGPVVANVLRAVKLADRAGRPIAVVRAAYDRAFDVLPPRLAADPTRLHFPCRAGSWGASLVPALAAALDDVTRSPVLTIDKHTYDAFREPAQLLDLFASQGVRTLVFCGTETQTCVLASAQHAALLGLRSFVLEDCVWSVNERLGSAALEIFANAYGSLLSLPDLEQWSA